MTPMLGIMASQISGHLSSPAFDSIATVTLTATTATVDFNSIPQTYKHLQLRWIGKSSATAYDTSGLYMQFNGDSAANYSQHYIYSNQTPVNNTYGYYNSSTYDFGIGAGGPNTNANFTNQFAVNQIDILNYTATDKYKTSQSSSGNAITGNYYSSQSRDGHNWRSLSAITSISFAPVSSSWATGTTCALYGIKG